MSAKHRHLEGGPLLEDQEDCSIGQFLPTHYELLPVNAESKLQVLVGRNQRQFRHDAPIVSSNLRPSTRTNPKECFLMFSLFLSFDALKGLRVSLQLQPASICQRIQRNQASEQSPKMAGFFINMTHHMLMGSAPWVLIESRLYSKPTPSSNSPSPNDVD